MDQIKTLEKIIEEEGSCNWIRNPDNNPREICSGCPLNKESRNCADFAEALYNIGCKSNIDQNKAYKKEAERLLVVIAFEEMLEGKHDGERDSSTGEDSGERG